MIESIGSNFIALQALMKKPIGTGNIKTARCAGSEMVQSADSTMLAINVSEVLINSFARQSEFRSKGTY